MKCGVDQSHEVSLVVFAHSIWDLGQPGNRRKLTQGASVFSHCPLFHDTRRQKSFILYLLFNATEETLPPQILEHERQKLERLLSPRFVARNSFYYYFRLLWVAAWDRSGIFVSLTAKRRGPVFPKALVVTWQTTAERYRDEQSLRSPRVCVTKKHVSLYRWTARSTARSRRIPSSLAGVAVDSARPRERLSSSNSGTGHL